MLDGINGTNYINESKPEQMPEGNKNLKPVFVMSVRTLVPVPENMMTDLIYNYKRYEYQRNTDQYIPGGVFFIISGKQEKHIHIKHNGIEYNANQFKHKSAG
jgi:hypothetical protein